LLAGVLAGLGTGLAARASEAPPEPVHPRSYASPSGEFVLFVDPTDIYARGPGDYRLARAGRTAWEGRKPYTLHEAGVTDEGAIAGYAYSNGRRGYSADSADRTPGDFRVIILDPSGNERLNEAHTREPSRFPHTPPNPLVRGMFLDAANDRFVVRVDDPDVNRRAESWWSFQLGAGKRLAATEVVGENGGSRSVSVLDARPVAGTPLVLIHWWRHEYRSPRSLVGGRFSLIDPAHRTVWSLELPEDYNVPGDENAEDRLRNQVRDQGVILNTQAGGRFDLRFVREARRGSFAVKKDGDAWDVREIASVPYEEPRPREGAAAIPRRRLGYLGKVDLEVGNAPASPVRDVVAFDFDARGSLGFTRREEGERSTFVLLAPDGGVSREVPLEAVRMARDVRGPGVVWIAADRWLIHLSSLAVGGKSTAWWVDGASGGVTGLQGFDCPAIEAADGTGDGGFVVLATRRYRNTMDSQLIAFDGEGRRRWSVEKDPVHPNVQFFRDGLAVTARKEIVVLRTTDAAIDTLDRDGKYLRTLDLKTAWAHKPNYLVGLATDAEGGFLVEDFGGPSPAVWMRAAGDVRLALPACKFADGRAADLRAFRVAPGGAIWATDRKCLARVAEDGTVAEVRGSPPSAAGLEEVAAACMDAAGNLYFADRRTHAVHVFSPDGKHLRTCVPDPADFPAGSRADHLTADGEGNVYLACLLSEPLGGREYLHFSPRGERVGKKRFGLEHSGRWHAQPASGNFWVVGYQEVYLTDPSGKLLREIRRQPDRGWLDGLRDACVARDGSLVLVVAGWHTAGAVLNFYSAAGEPLRTVPLVLAGAPLALAYDGRRAVVSTEAEMLWIDAAGGSMERLEFPDSPPAAGSRLFLRGEPEAELWVVERKTIRRFAASGGK
jgi:hypothetical protein